MQMTDRLQFSIQHRRIEIKLVDIFLGKRQSNSANFSVSPIEHRFLAGHRYFSGGEPFIMYRLVVYWRGTLVSFHLFDFSAAQLKNASKIARGSSY